MSSTENIQLWETLLKKSSKSNQQQGGGTLLLVGDTGCGKRSLAAALSALSSPPPSSSSSRAGVSSSSSSVPIPAVAKYPEYISYSYFNAAGEGEDYNSDGLKVDVWRMCRETFTDSVDLILDPSRVTDNLVIAIATDVSQPDCATTLHTWLSLVHSTVDQFVARREKVLSSSSSIGSLDSNSGDGTGTGTGQEESKTSPREGGGGGGGGGVWRPAVLVVGCKADTLAADDVEGLARSKATQGALRAVCLHGGASGLIFTSAAPPNTNTSNSSSSPSPVAHTQTRAPSNCQALRSHLALLLTSSPLQPSAPSSPTATATATGDSLLGGGVIQDGTTDVIIPDMRADSAALILSATDVQASLVMDSILQNTTPPLASNSGSSSNSSNSSSGSSSSDEKGTPSLSSGVLEEEGQWLKQFQSTTPSSSHSSSVDKDASLTASLSALELSETGSTSTVGTARRKSTLSTNPLAAAGAKTSSSSAAEGLSSLLEQGSSTSAGAGAGGKEGSGGGAKVVKKKKAGSEKKDKDKEKKASPRGFFEDLLTK